MYSPNYINREEFNKKYFAPYQACVKQGCESKAESIRRAAAKFEGVTIANSNGRVVTILPNPFAK